MAACTAKLMRGAALIFTVINAFCPQLTLLSSYISSFSGFFFPPPPRALLPEGTTTLTIRKWLHLFAFPSFLWSIIYMLVLWLSVISWGENNKAVGACMHLFSHFFVVFITPYYSLNSILFFSLSLCLSLSQSLLFCIPPSLSVNRKPVNMNKTPITYRQEKSHMGSMERSFTDQSTLQEDERMALSFMDAHTCGTRSKTSTQINSVHRPSSFPPLCNFELRSHRSSLCNLVDRRSFPP